MTEADLIWRTDPATLRDVILDRNAVDARLEDCPVLERVRILSLLDRHEEALKEGHKLQENSGDRFKPLLALAHAYQCQYQWREAARLQEEALRLAFTRPKEALVRHHIGRRLFDEARYRDAAAEFEWASDLYRAAGRVRLAEVSRQAALRARELYMARAQSMTLKVQPNPERVRESEALGSYPPHSACPEFS